MTMDYDLTLEDEKEPIRMVYYGDPGTRKTSYMAAMSQLGKVVHIDAEEGLKPTALRRLGIDVSNIIPVRRVTYMKLEDLMYEWLDIIAKGNDLPFIGINFDSATAMIDRFISGVVDSQVRKADAKGEDRARWKVYQEDYGDMTNQIKNLLRGYRDLPVHLCIAAHAKREKDEEDAVRIGPSVNPAVRDAISVYSDLILNTDIVAAPGYPKGLGYARTQTIGKFDGKDRFGVLPKNMINPTFPRVLQYVEGDLEWPGGDEEQAAGAKAMKGETSPEPAEASDTPTNTDEPSDSKE